jgi:DNA repair protein SbcC/Rad50
MNDINAKRYYKKINTTFVGLNEVDDFALLFNNILKSGNTTLYQKERRERRVFDDAWMTSVEEAIPAIDRITRSPRETLKRVQQLLPVERAKKIDSDTIRHLASHTENIKSVGRGGEVIPSKVMTSYSEGDIGTYENRFIKTLVDKLYLFIEKRYDLIVQKLHTEYVNFLNVKNEAEWNDAVLEFDVTLKIKQNLAQDEIDRKNQELFDRMTFIRTNITNFKNSNFMNQMRVFGPISPPIMKTNIIIKNTDFRQCYDLWIMMDAIDQIGFDVDVYERDVQFDDKYIDQLNTAMLVLYATVANNQKSEFVLQQENPFEYRSIKRPKISKNHPQDLRIEPGTIKLENNFLNQYYLEQIKKSNYSRFKTLREAGITIEESIEIVFKQIGQISNAVYEDYIQQNYNVENEKTLEDKIMTQDKILELYRQIEKIKREDLRSLTTQRAIALLQLRNMRDDLAAKRVIDKAELEKQREEERLEKEREKRQKELDAINRKKRIEREKASLEAAAKKRAEQKIVNAEKKKAKIQADKLKAKELRDKQRAIEAAKKQKAKELELDKLAKEKARLKEQAKLAKEKELAKERALKAKEAEKQKKAKAALAEKERLTREKAKAAEKEKLAKEKAKALEVAKAKALKEKELAQASKDGTPRKPKPKVEPISTETISNE